MVTLYRCIYLPTGSSKTFVVANATISRSCRNFRGLDLFFGFFERVNCYLLFVRHCFVRKAREKVTDLFHKRTEVLCHTLLPVLHSEGQQETLENYNFISHIYIDYDNSGILLGRVRDWRHNRLVYITMLKRTTTTLYWIVEFQWVFCPLSLRIIKITVLLGRVKEFA